MKPFDPDDKKLNTLWHEAVDRQIKAETVWGATLYKDDKLGLKAHDAHLIQTTIYKVWQDLLNNTPSVKETTP